MAKTQLSYSLEASRIRRWFHWRVVAFVVAFAVLIGLPLYWWGQSLIEVATIYVGKYQKVDLKTMANFDFDQTKAKVADIPKQFRDLDGKNVLLTGEMWASSTAPDASVNYFQLTDTPIHSYQPQPPVAQQFVDCTVPPGKTEYCYSGRVEARGVFHVKIYKDDSGAIKSIYQLDVENVKPIDNP